MHMVLYLIMSCGARHWWFPIKT